ncbi:carbonic anhydrase family protein [Convivina intestini]|uniref:carbonic anhydrase n=1 Tax=Convivina intestini TaxID=1505726 RepID=A0A2U1D578_9LACO|nr:carbonic anhydrase family protein [Convivina intestini]PVY82827.1 carbonic anhydrase [Convivina intestini]CAH1856816.1 Carbonic anhydrase [Convivina intestini]SDC16263.1 carbonic anhydrase [Leuconostocaceae bacterium R-53105]
MARIDYRDQDQWSQTTRSTNQSPINIQTNQVQVRPLSQIQIILNNLRGITAKEIPSGQQFFCEGQVNINGQSWQMERFHFHDGAEHLLDGQRYDGELHLVLKNDQQTAVLGAWLVADENKTSLALKQLFHANQLAFSLRSLLPQAQGYYHYQGTLTTPPLLENIEWFILDQPLALNPNDLAAIRANFPDNHRQIQADNGRLVEYFPVQFHIGNQFSD